MGITAVDVSYERPGGTCWGGLVQHLPRLFASRPDCLAFLVAAAQVIAGNVGEASCERGVTCRAIIGCCLRTSGRLTAPSSIGRWRPTSMSCCSLCARTQHRRDGAKRVRTIRLVNLPANDSSHALKARCPSDRAAIICAMRTRSIQPGDIVYANKKGRLFHAKVVGTSGDGVLIVEPIEHNISYRQLRASEIAEHWTHTATTPRQDRRPPTQTTFDLSLLA
jgi:hypothetical protein